MMSVAVTTDEELDAEPPRVLFEDPYLSPFTNPSVGETTYDVSPDGRHFVMISIPPEARRNQLHVVLNWFQELERLVPTE